MVYYKIPVTDACFDYPAGCVLCCAYYLDGVMYCQFEYVVEVGPGWERITKETFDALRPEVEVVDPVVTSNCIVTIQLPASGWVGSNSVYSQVVEIKGLTEKSKIDLQPAPEQLVELLTEEIALTAVNDRGIVTVYAFGGAPVSDFVMQATVTNAIESLVFSAGGNN